MQYSKYLLLVLLVISLAACTNPNVSVSTATPSSLVIQEKKATVILELSPSRTPPLDLDSGFIVVETSFETPPPSLTPTVTFTPTLNLTSTLVLGGTRIPSAIPTTAPVVKAVTATPTIELITFPKREMFGKESCT